MRPWPLNLRRQQPRLLLRLLLPGVPKVLHNKPPERRPRQPRPGRGAAEDAEVRAAAEIQAPKVLARVPRRLQTRAEVVADSRTSA